MRTIISAYHPLLQNARLLIVTSTREVNIYTNFVATEETQLSVMQEKFSERLIVLVMEDASEFHLE